jgi:hypothetical protein
MGYSNVAHKKFVQGEKMFKNMKPLQVIAIVFGAVLAFGCVCSTLALIAGDQLRLAIF